MKMETVNCQHWNAGACGLNLYGGRPSAGVCSRVCDQRVPLTIGGTDETTERREIAISRLEISAGIRGRNGAAYLARARELADEWGTRTAVFSNANLKQLQTEFPADVEAERKRGEAEARAEPKTEAKADGGCCKRKAVRNAIKNLSRGAASIAKTSLGIDRASDEQFTARLAVCEACPGNHAQRNKRGQITTCGPMVSIARDRGENPCGCILDKKARDIKEHCPYGYWAKVDLTFSPATEEPAAIKQNNRLEGDKE